MGGGKDKQTDELAGLVVVDVQPLTSNAIDNLAMVIRQSTVDPSRDY